MAWLSARPPVTKGRTSALDGYPPSAGVYRPGVAHLRPIGGDVRTHRYRITISGRLGDIGCEAFADFDSEPSGPDTALIADLDQAALYGALNRILSLGFELVEVRRL